MNQELAESVKDLAKPTVKALGVITERKCPLCKGGGFHWAMTVGEKDRKKDSCIDCSGTGKIRWQRKPKKGEWFLLNGRVYLIDSDRLHSIPDISIPILHWEEIERVLERVGYWVNLYLETKGWWCRIKKESHCYGEALGKSRQEAVCRAVIALGIEPDAKSK